MTEELFKIVPKVWEWWKKQTKLITFLVMLAGLGVAFWYTRYGYEKKVKDERVDQSITLDAQVILKTDSVRTVVVDLTRAVVKLEKKIDDVEKRDIQRGKTEVNEIAANLRYIVEFYDQKDKRNNQMILEHIDMWKNTHNNLDADTFSIGVIKK